MGGNFKLIFSNTLRSLKRLCLEVMATFFIALALIGVSSIVDEYRKYSNSAENGVFRLSMSILFSTVMLISGLHTFWKARKSR
jgi:hypothetical protein